MARIAEVALLTEEGRSADLEDPAAVIELQAT